MGTRGGGCSRTRNYFDRKGAGGQWSVIKDGGEAEDGVGTKRQGIAGMEGRGGADWRLLIGYRKRIGVAVGGSVGTAGADRRGPIVLPWLRCEAQLSPSPSPSPPAPRCHPLPLPGSAELSCLIWGPLFRAQLGERGLFLAALW